jgi:hypothetical protein
MSELQNMASISGRGQQFAQPLRPLPTVVGAGTIDWHRRRGLPAMPSSARPSERPCCGCTARSSLALMVATRRRPRLVQVVGHGGADALFVRKADQHVDRGRRQVPGLDHRECRWPSAAPALGERMMPVSTTPSGRRPMMASSSASSREFS